MDHMRFCVFCVQSDLKWRQWIFRLLKKYAWRIISIKGKILWSGFKKEKMLSLLQMPLILSRAFRLLQ